MNSNEDIIKELRAMKTELEEIKKTTKRMDSHITWVEKIFNITLYPFLAIMGVSPSRRSIEPISD